MTGDANNMEVIVTETANALDVNCAPSSLTQERLLCWQSPRRLRARGEAHKHRALTIDSRVGHARGDSTHAVTPK